MPRSADPAVRAALVDAAARILAVDGPQGLSTRRLATEVGASTMAVYTYFGSMEEVRRAVRREGLTRLDAELAAPPTEDPVADLVAAGVIYLTSGLRNPELYRAMFFVRPPEDSDDPGAGVFQRLVAAVRRCVDAGRFHPVDPPTSVAWAGEIWTMCHGMVTLALTGLLPDQQIHFLLTDMSYRLVIGYGDDPVTARRSVDDGAGREAPEE